MVSLENITQGAARFDLISGRTELSVVKYRIGYELKEKAVRFDNKPVERSYYFIKKESLLREYEKRFRELSDIKLKDWLG